MNNILRMTIFIIYAQYTIDNRFYYWQIKYMRIDGSVKESRREQAVKEFQTNHECQVRELALNKKTSIIIKQGYISLDRSLVYCYCVFSVFF